MLLFPSDHSFLSQFLPHAFVFGVHLVAVASPIGIDVRLRTRPTGPVVIGLGLTGGFRQGGRRTLHRRTASQIEAMSTNSRAAEFHRRRVLRSRTGKSSLDDGRRKQFHALAVRLGDVDRPIPFRIDEVEKRSTVDQSATRFHHFVFHRVEQRRALFPVRRVQIAAALDQLLQQRRSIVVFFVRGKPMQKVLVADRHHGLHHRARVSQKIEHRFIAILHGVIDSERRE